MTALLSGAIMPRILTAARFGRQVFYFCFLLAVSLLRTTAAQETAPPTSQEKNEPPKASHNLLVDPLPASIKLHGDVTAGPLGDGTKEHSGHGLRLHSGPDQNGDGRREGYATATYSLPAGSTQRWYQLRIQALAQDEFRVAEDDLYLRVNFFRDGGKNSLDHVKQSLYENVERDRQALADPGTNKKLGRATWRAFELTFRTPFAEVDTLELQIGFGHGDGAAERNEFWVREWQLIPIPVPADYQAPQPPPRGRPATDRTQLVALGGRWYYDPVSSDRTPPAEFNFRNAERLYYLSDRLEQPFVGNMSAWLRRGYLDKDGKLVKEDRWIDDNVVISFTKTHLVVRSQNLPNHPTAVFPDRSRSLDGNPNYIQQRESIHQIPLEPQVNPNHVAMKNSNNNDHALPMGPIGVAVNGVVFFNPFDHLLDEDAVWRLDRCCGHPSPRSQYHYHKYPVCVKTPWSDDGQGHSPLIGFAKDGFPVYGPYEAAKVLAKDSTDHPLNEFNLHEDADRGPHYHVTPGKFPHILGGYWGKVEAQRPGGDRPPPPPTRIKGSAKQ